MESNLGPWLKAPAGFPAYIQEPMCYSCEWAILIKDHLVSMWAESTDNMWNRNETQISCRFRRKKNATVLNHYILGVIHYAAADIQYTSYLSYPHEVIRWEKIETLIYQPQYSLPHVAQGCAYCNAQNICWPEVSTFFFWCHISNEIKYISFTRTQLDTPKLLGNDMKCKTQAIKPRSHIFFPHELGYRRILNSHY